MSCIPDVGHALACPAACGACPTEAVSGERLAFGFAAHAGRVVRNCRGLQRCSSLVAQRGGAASCQRSAFSGQPLGWWLLVLRAHFGRAKSSRPAKKRRISSKRKRQQAEIQPRFEKWLEGCLIEGIAKWRRTLV